MLLLHDLIVAAIAYNKQAHVLGQQLIQPRTIPLFCGQRHMEVSRVSPPAGMQETNKTIHIFEHHSPKRFC